MNAEGSCIYQATRRRMEFQTKKQYYYYSMRIIVALWSRFSAARALEILCHASSIMKVFHIYCKGNVPRLVKHVAFENM